MGPRCEFVFVRFVADERCKHFRKSRFGQIGDFSNKEVDVATGGTMRDLTSWSRYEWMMYMVFYRVPQLLGPTVTRVAWPATALVVGLTWQFPLGALRALGYVGAAAAAAAAAGSAFVLFAVQVGRLPEPRGGRVVVVWDLELSVDGNPFVCKVFAPRRRQHITPKSSTPTTTHAPARSPTDNTADPVRWLSEPQDEYIVALGSMVGLSPWWARALLGGMRRVVLPGAVLGPPSAGGDDDDGAPVVVFSHGLCGTSFMYASSCVELASAGFLVVAPEHADGTAAITVTSAGTTAYKRGVAETPSAMNRRLREVDEVLRAVVSGAVPGVPARQDRMVAIAGHSFGGATAVAAAARWPDRFVGCVALDPWLDPVRQAGGTGARSDAGVSAGAWGRGGFDPIGRTPLLVVATGSMLYDTNARHICELFQVASSAGHADPAPPPGAFVEVAGSRHQDQSDVSCLFEWANKALCASGPLRATRAWAASHDCLVGFLLMCCGTDHPRSAPSPAHRAARARAEAAVRGDPTGAGPPLKLHDWAALLASDCAK